MLVRHDQDMRRRDGVQVAESRHLLIVIEDRGRGTASNDFAEDTIRVDGIHIGCHSCEDVGGVCFHEKNST